MINFPETEKDIDTEDKKEGDILQAGLLIRNSEVGKSGIYIIPRVFRCVCNNGLTVWKNKGNKKDFYKRHRGLTMEEMFTFSKKAITKAINEACEGIKDMKKLKEQKIEKPEDKILQICNNFKIKASNRNKIVELWKDKWSNNNTMYGIVNSITNVARNLNQDDQMKLEQTAGKIVA
jgi:hypothetical protein